MTAAAAIAAITATGTVPDVTLFDEVEDAWLVT
jgi:hypothetical protein